MPVHLSNNARKIYAYLQSIHPQGATNSDIEDATQIHPHAQVFQITRRLTEQGLLRSERGLYGEKEWIFFMQSTPGQAGVRIYTPTEQIVRPAQEISDFGMSPKEFELLAARVMSVHYGIRLSEGSVVGVPKRFDLISKDGSVVGDAKYFTLVGGQRLPPAKFSVIAEHVWLLEKTQAEHKFLVFGNQREVPTKWLLKYGHLSKAIKFFFIDAQGMLEELY